MRSSPKARGYMNTMSGGVAGVVLTLVVMTGCGGHSGKDKGERKSDLVPKRGGEVTYLSASDVDFLDPGQTYSSFGYMVHYAVNRTRSSFKPDGSRKPVPDLAAGPPRISADNKTVTVRI